jgi:hypothetical protein
VSETLNAGVKKSSVKQAEEAFEQARRHAIECLSRVEANNERLAEAIAAEDVTMADTLGEEGSRLWSEHLAASRALQEAHEAVQAALLEAITETYRKQGLVPPGDGSGGTRH